MNLEWRERRSERFWMGKTGRRCILGVRRLVCHPETQYRCRCCQKLKAHTKFYTLFYLRSFAEEPSLSWKWDSCLHVHSKPCINFLVPASLISSFTFAFPSRRQLRSPQEAIRHIVNNLIFFPLKSLSFLLSPLFAPPQHSPKQWRTSHPQSSNKCSSHSHPDPVN